MECEEIRVDMRPSRKKVQAELTELKQEYAEVYEDFCTARTHYTETRNIRINYQALLGKEEPEREKEVAVETAEK